MSTAEAVQVATASPSAPAKLPIKLPSSFANSFWTSDYRVGWSTILNKLENGVLESEQALAFLGTRAKSERNTAQALELPQLFAGFAQDEGSNSGLQRGFQALLHQSHAESQARLKLAATIEDSCLTPFQRWHSGHKDRIINSKNVVGKLLHQYETQLGRVQGLKISYDSARRKADEAEDEAIFENGGTPIKLPPPPSADEDENDAIDTDSDSGETIQNLSRALTKRTASLRRALTVKLNQSLAPTESSDLPPATPEKNTVDDSIMSSPTPSTPEATNVNSALEWGRSRLTSLLAGSSEKGESKDVTTRRQADLLEENYREAILQLDSLRLALEATISSHLAFAQRMEIDRIRALSTVLKTFATAVESIVIPRLSESTRSAIETIDLIRAETDIAGVIETLKTGPFIPSVTVFNSPYAGEAPLTRFGNDLSTAKSLPSILTYLLNHLQQHSTANPTKSATAWILEPPLAAVHHLRIALNDVASLEDVDLERYDLPVVTGAVRLWLLELTPPPFSHTAYDEIKVLYPRVGGAGAGDEAVLEKLVGILSRLSVINFEVIRVLITHLADLLAATKSTTEEYDLHLTKLSLTLSRCLLRPAVYNSLNIDDRFPATVFCELVRNVGLFEKAEGMRKERGAEERIKPRRQRTRPIDKRRFRESSSSSTPAESSQQETQETQITPPPVESHSPTSNSTVDLISSHTSPTVVTSALPSTSTASTAPTTIAETGSLAPPTTKAPLQRSKRASLRGPRVQGAISKFDKTEEGGKAQGEEGEKRGRTPEGEKSDHEGEQFEECL